MYKQHARLHLYLHETHTQTQRPKAKYYYYHNSSGKEYFYDVNAMSGVLASSYGELLLLYFIIIENYDIQKALNVFCRAVC